MKKQILALISVGALVGAVISGSTLDAAGPVITKKAVTIQAEGYDPLANPRSGAAGAPVALNYVTSFEPANGFVARDATCTPDAACVSPSTGQCGFIGGQGNGPYPEPWAVSTSQPITLTEPHIDVVHPFSGVQHLRFSEDLCDDPTPYSFAVDARVPASPPLPGLIAPSTYSVQIAIDTLFGTNVFFQPQSNSQGILTTRTMFYFYGWFYILDDQGDGLQYYPALTPWDASGTYKNFTVHHDPCANFICLGGYGGGAYSGQPCPNGNRDCRYCVGGDNDGLNCLGNFECPGGTCEGGYCYGRADYWYDGQLIYQGSLYAGTSSEQFLVYTDNYPANVDIDDVVIETGEPCPIVCGNLEVEAGEECDGLNDDFCPGNCVAPGATGPHGEGECECVRPGATCEDATPLLNGTQTGGISHGGWWTFIADAPAYAIETCGTTTHDTGIWAITGTCNTMDIILYNDDCDDNTYGFGENADPLASCYAIGGISAPYESCACFATNIGQQYWIYDARNGLGREAVMTLTKRLDCGAVWDNGACCNRIDGTCADDVASADCANYEDTWTMSKLCASDAVACEPSPGACCDRSPGLGGLCVDGVLNADCQGRDQVWTLETACADVTCLEARGACCDGLTGNCTNGQLRENCFGQNVVWSQELTCADTSGCDPIPGACCDYNHPDPLSREGVCTNGVSMADCQGETQVWTKGASCAQVDCTRPLIFVIPTVSEWGMAVLALVLIILGKLAFGRIRNAREASS